MEILDSSEFQLITKDFNDLRHDICAVNEISDWDKLIIVYNFYMLMNYVYYTYSLLDILNKDSNKHFQQQFMHLYLFFYCFSSMKDCYLYFIRNVCRINFKLGIQMHLNMKQYFML